MLGRAGRDGKGVVNEAAGVVEYGQHGLWRRHSGLVVKMRGLCSYQAAARRLNRSGIAYVFVVWSAGGLAQTRWPCVVGDQCGGA